MVKDRRLASFSLSFLDGRHEKPAVCARNCAQPTVPNTLNKGTTQSAGVVALSVRGDGVTAGRLGSFVVESVRVSACVLYTCTSAVRWPRG